MTNFQFSQSHINRLAEAGVKWAFEDQDPSTGRPREIGFVYTRHLEVDGLTPRGLLVGTATDLLEKLYGRGGNVQLLSETLVSATRLGSYDKHPSQEENLIDMIVHLSAKLKAKEEPPVTLDTLNERLTRIERKFQ